MLASSAATLPEGDQWSYEVKWDGYRTLASKDGTHVTLLSRNLKDATAQYPSVARAVTQIRDNATLLDGEIVAIDEHRPLVLSSPPPPSGSHRGVLRLRCVAPERP